MCPGPVRRNVKAVELEARRHQGNLGEYFPGDGGWGGASQPDPTIALSADASLPYSAFLSLAAIYLNISCFSSVFSPS